MEIFVYEIAEGLEDLAYGITIRLNNLIIKGELCLKTQIPGIYGILFFML